MLSKCALVPSKELPVCGDEKKSDDWTIPASNGAHLNEGEIWALGEVEGLE